MLSVVKVRAGEHGACLPVAPVPVLVGSVCGRHTNGILPEVCMRYTSLRQTRNKKY